MDETTVLVPMRATNSPAPQQRIRYATEDHFIETAEGHPTSNTSVYTRARVFLLRIDVCCTFFFFLFLVAVSAVMASVTLSILQPAVLRTWHDAHHIQPASLLHRIDLTSLRVRSMAQEFASLHTNAPVVFQSEATLSTLCSVMMNFDRDGIVNTFTVSSYALRESTTCMHGVGGGVPLNDLVGYVSVNHTVNASYFIDEDTYEFEHPLRVATEWPVESRNISRVIEWVVNTVPIFAKVRRFSNDNDINSSALDMREAWLPAPTAPHLISFNVPYGILMKHLEFLPQISRLDYVQARINGTRLLANDGLTNDDAVRMAIFINSSLSTTEPLIMSNSWGQQTIFNEPIYMPLAETSVRYLRARDVSCPLMREALKHVDLARLQQDKHDQTVDFRYRGAPATVNARMYTTTIGLTVPLVYVSASAEIAGPYGRVMDICTGVLAAVVVLFTALFWYFIRASFAVPLRQMTELLCASAETGRRRVYEDARQGVIRLTEVRELADAHNDMMRRLRDIDQFVPEPVRRQQRAQQYGSGVLPKDAASVDVSEEAEEMADRVPSALRSQTLSVVCVTMRAASGSGAVRRRSSGPPVATLNVAGRPAHLVEVVESAAHAIGAVNSGPFASPDALSAFVAAVHRLSHQSRGVVHQLTPEHCTVHFGAAVQAHMQCHPNATALSVSPEILTATSALTAEQWDYERCARRDARDAVGFALALQQWVDAARPDGGDAVWPADAAASCMPDVRSLVDTGVFTCGAYRAPGSEQTLSVAFGRDVQREVGHVPALIGVRVAMTAETACRVRAKRNACAGTNGVRQLPVEVLCTGRAGLDEDVVMLFEALPGRVAGDEAWRLYAHFCFDGFSHMLRGDYAGALHVYKEVAEISDLEPGLLPASLRREAAVSCLSGGAVSVQVQRLMRECERRVRASDTRPFCRGRHVPLSIDAVLQRIAAAAPLPCRKKRSSIEHAVLNSRIRESETKPAADTALSSEKCTRFVAEMAAVQGHFRCVVGSVDKPLQDNYGQVWRVASSLRDCPATELLTRRFTALNTAGTLASVNFLAFPDVPAEVAAAIRELPVGPLRGEMAKHVPAPATATHLKRACHTVFCSYRPLHHPSLMAPIAYSVSTEGGMVGIWEFCWSRTLREVIHRYRELRPVTVVRFAWHVTSALSYLHQRGHIHGRISSNNVMIAADGRCRLLGHCLRYEMMTDVFAIARIVYVSPAMAAGHAPTPACDMFCYGLLCLEMLSRGKVWKWAPVVEGQPQPTEEELQALLTAVEQPFFDAVAEGRLVPDTDVLDSTTMTLNENRRQACVTIRRLVSSDPAQRPRADEAHRELTKFLESNGLSIEHIHE